MLTKTVQTVQRKSVGSCKRVINRLTAANQCSPVDLVIDHVCPEDDVGVVFVVKIECYCVLQAGDERFDAECVQVDTSQLMSVAEYNVWYCGHWNRPQLGLRDSTQPQNYRF